MLELKCLNQSKLTIDNDLFIIDTPKKSDYFNSPIVTDEKISITNTAPFYYKEVHGDFTISVAVKNNFTDEYDAGAIFIYETDYKWIKLAYEKTDFNTNAIVSVITNQTSDDANGANVEKEWVYLMASRKGDSFALHYSLDNKTYIMVRLFRLETDKKLKVGITAQSPVGDESEVIFKDLNITKYRLKDLRSGTL